MASRADIRQAMQPTFWDRMVGTISPRRGLDRLRYRVAYAAASGYDGARRDRKATLSWATRAGSGDADTLPGLDVLRARSRDLVRNDPVAQSAISTKVVNVIGHGHQVRPELDPERLGLSPEEAQAWENAALDIWRDWADGEDCDVTRSQTFAGLEDLVYRSRLLSGDVLVLRRFRERTNRLLGTCLQVVEADRLSNPHWTPDSGGMAGGIEIDEDGAAVAYHIANRHLVDRHRAGAVTWRRIPAFDTAGERQVLHIKGARWRPDMSRYAPMLAPVIESLRQRSKYSEAELMAAVVSACFAVGLKSPEGGLGEGLAELQAGEPVSGRDGEFSRQVQQAQPGTVFDLEPDESVQAFEPGRPNPQFSPFIDAIAQEVGAGTDLPHELLMKRFTSSYSASRAAMEMAWQFFRADRALHVHQFCKPVYATVIGEAVARGILNAPGFFSDPLRRRAWLNASWMGPSRPTIDPTKDMKADEGYLKMGATSLTRITAERFGADARDVRRRRSEDGSEEATLRLSSGASLPQDIQTEEGQ